MGSLAFFEAVRPLTLHAEKTETMVQISVHFHPRVRTVPYWEIYIDEQNDMMRTLGKAWNKGDMNVSSMEVKPDTNVKELKFRLASSIGEIALELNFQELKEFGGDIEIPDLGVRPLVPAAYRPLAVESSCTEQYIYVKFEKTGDTSIDLSYGRDVEFWFEDEMGLSDENNFYYNHFLEKSKEYYGMEIELKEEYVRNGSEVKARYRDSTLPGDVNKYIDSMSLNVYSHIKAPEPSQYVFIPDTLSVFIGLRSSFKISDKVGNPSIDCAAFGHPKPVIEVLDQNGTKMHVAEISIGNGMTTHVIASLEEMPSNQIYGKYTCIARSGDSTTEQTLTVKENEKAKQ